jgi:hypothetical protein
MSFRCILFQRQSVLQGIAVDRRKLRVLALDEPADGDRTHDIADFTIRSSDL